MVILLATTAVLRTHDITDRVMLILRAAVQQLVARSEIQLSMLCPNLSTDDSPCHRQQEEVVSEAKCLHFGIYLAPLLQFPFIVLLETACFEGYMIHIAYTAEPSD
jgi:hypothetical protein